MSGDRIINYLTLTVVLIPFLYMITVGLENNNSWTFLGSITLIPICLVFIGITVWYDRKKETVWVF